MKSVDMAELVETLVHNKVVVVDVFAEWCKPCQNMLRILPPLVEELKDKAVFVKVDGDKDELVKQMYNITKYPTFLFFKGGQEVYRGNVMLLKDIKQKVLELQ